MRTERAILFGTHFFAYWNEHVFYTHGHSVDSFATPKFLPNFATSKGREDIEKLNGNDLFHSAY